ncbi:MAG: hypothetical protein ACR2K2_16435 [Mycobacteriales bacterium]
MELLGTVLRLQVQRSRLKPGERGARVYDPVPLLQVVALEVGPRGVVGVTEDGPLLDVHHADHPDSRNVKLRNGLSLLPLPHHTALRTRYGEHLFDGAAGESLLLDTAGPWTLDALAGPLRLDTADGDLLELTHAAVASPCVEFSRFCLGRGLGPVDAAVEQAMRDLDGGARGFYVRTAGSGRIQAGARLWTVAGSSVG